MRALSGIVAALLLLSAVITLAAVGSKPPQTADPLIVHEWGTFTSFAGSDGIRLDFRPLVDSDLPPFVYHRAKQAGFDISAEKLQIIASQRMETPVTYFYTGHPRDVRVRVGFPRGLLTEFYPPVRAMEPAFDPQAEFADGATIEGGMLDWGTIHLLPPEMAKGVKLPVSTTRMDHYAHARDTNSAIVKFQRLVKSSNDAPPRRETHYEKYLFYRGVGSFSLPLLLTAEPDGRFQLRNAGRQQVRALFLVNVADDGLRFAQWDAIGAGQSMRLSLPAKTASVDRLADAVVDAAVRHGLYAKEARAMVNTWRSSWFGEPGTRLFYILPQPLVDELLPLEVEPAPEVVVRVLVGRLEVMTPADETRLHAQLRATNGEDLPGLVEALKKQLGRFAESALDRARDIAPDAGVKANAERALKMIRPAP